MPRNSGQDRNTPDSLLLQALQRLVAPQALFLFQLHIFHSCFFTSFFCSRQSRNYANRKKRCCSSTLPHIRFIPPLIPLRGIPKEGGVSLFSLYMHQAPQGPQQFNGCPKPQWFLTANASDLSTLQSQFTSPAHRLQIECPKPQWFLTANASDLSTLPS